MLQAVIASKTKFASCPDTVGMATSPRIRPKFAKTLNIYYTPH